MLSQSAVCPTLPVTDLARAKEFYTNKLGLKVSKEYGEMGGGFMVEAGKGSGIFLFESDPPKSADTAASFDVNDLDKEMAELRKNGVVFEEYDLPHLKTKNGVAVMGGTRAAWFKDPDGNILALTETKK